MKIIAFGHRKRTGKDTIAKAFEHTLSEKMGKNFVRKIAFADPLYQICHELYSWDGFGTKEDYDLGFKDKTVLLPNIGKTPRQILIEMGTPAIRQVVYERTWIDCALKNQPPDIKLLLISDLRFPNEFDAVKEAGGVCVRVDRPAIEPTEDIADSALASETRWDCILVNDGSIRRLVYSAATALSEYLERRLINDF